MPISPGPTPPTYDAEVEVRLREMQVKRLEAVIRDKEARLSALRERTSSENSPPLNSPQAVPPETPPTIRRRSSSLINVEQAKPNEAPLGRLQPHGRADYEDTVIARSAAAAAAGLGSRRARNAELPRERGGLQPSGLPSALVVRWTGGATSEDVLHELLESVSRAGCGSAPPPLRELASMTQQWSADRAAALGGPLGGMAGGLPAFSDGVDLSPLHELLATPVEAAVVQAMLLFTRELLTGAETEAASSLADRHRLQQDLAKLSAEELNLAFRRACLKQHPGRAEGSLAGLLRVHFLFELLVLEWAELLPSMPNAPATTDVAAALPSPNVGDSTLLRELAKSDLELTTESLELGDEQVDSVNAQMQAQAMYMCRVRDLLEEQLEAYQAIGAYAVLGCDPVRPTPCIPARLLCPS